MVDFIEDERSHSLLFEAIEIMHTSGHYGLDEKRDDLAEWQSLAVNEQTLLQQIVTKGVTISSQELVDELCSLVTSVLNRFASLN